MVASMGVIYSAEAAEMERFDLSKFNKTGFL